MSDTLILYRSKYGSSEKYARLLKEELPDADCAKAGSVRLKNYDKVIYVAGVYSGKINGLSRVLPKLADKKKAAVCAVGFYLPDRNYLGRLREKNAVPPNVKMYYMRGAMDIGKLKGLDSTVIKRTVSVLMLRDDLRPAERAIVNAGLTPQEWVCRENILPVAEWIKE